MASTVGRAGEPFSYVARPIAPCRRALIVIAVGRRPVAAEQYLLLQHSLPSYGPTRLRSANPSRQSLHVRRKTPCEAPPRSFEYLPSREIRTLRTLILLQFAAANVSTTSPQTGHLNHQQHQ